MSIDYSGFAIPKGTPRVVARLKQKADRAAVERACRLAVHKRDKRRCVVPGCREVARHLHHIQARSLGGQFSTANICSLCVRHHQLLHGGCIQIDGNADEHLTITGDKKYLTFVL